MSSILENLKAEAENTAQDNQQQVTDTVETQVSPEQTTDTPTQETVDNNTVDNTETQNNDTTNAGETTETPAQEKPAKSFASEKVAKYNEFVAKTGKEDYREFEFWQTPTNEVDQKELLRKYYSEKEGMTEKEIAFEMSKLEVASQNADDDFLDDEISEKERLEKEVHLERELRKARAWHEGEFKSFSENVVEATETNEVQPDGKMTVEEYNKMVLETQHNLYKDNLEKIYQTLPEIKGLELKIPANDRQGISSLDVVFTPDEDYSKELRAVSEDVGVVINQFYENGNLKDPKGWITEAAWAYKPTRDKMIQFAIEQAVLNDRAARSNQRRNVTADNYQSVSTSSVNSEVAFEDWRKNRQ